jgi:hypothetical protein
MCSITALSILCLAHVATATFYNGGKNGTGYYYEGAYGQAAPDSIPSLAPFEYGATHPNATNSVPIGNFTWRTNVSEISVTGATTTPGNGTDILNARIITTVFDLTWDTHISTSNNSEVTIGQALQAQHVVSPFGCITMIDGLDLAENVTSKYTAADNGSCTNVLGGDCVRDLLASIDGTPGDPSECPGLPSQEDLPASCAGTLGTLYTATFGVFTESEYHRSYRLSLKLS